MILTESSGFSDEVALPSLNNDDETTEWDPSVNWIVEAITARRMINGHVQYQVSGQLMGAKLGKY